jgi:hypothetical protein
MLFQRINRSDPERIFIVVKNGYSTASLTNGQAVGWDLTDADGVNVTKIGATDIAHSFAGIVAETIAAGDYGLMQVYGYHSAVRVDASTTADIFTGCALYARVAAFNLKNGWQASGASTAITLNTIGAPAAVALEAYGSVGTTGTIAAIIHAL